MVKKINESAKNISNREYDTVNSTEFQQQISSLSSMLTSSRKQLGSILRNYKDGDIPKSLLDSMYDIYEVLSVQGKELFKYVG